MVYQRVLTDIEDQAFLRLYDSAPFPPPSTPLPPAGCLSFSVFLRDSPVELTDVEGVGDWRGAKSYDREKDWSSINHSILSVAYKLLEALSGANSQNTLKKETKTQVFTSTCVPTINLCRFLLNKQFPFFSEKASLQYKGSAIR